jgi:hypothetical protein
MSSTPVQVNRRPGKAWQQPRKDEGLRAFPAVIQFVRIVIHETACHSLWPPQNDPSTLLPGNESFGWIAQLVEQRTENCKLFIVKYLQIFSPLCIPFANQHLHVLTVIEAFPSSAQFWAK